MRLTRRGKAVVAAAVITFAVLVNVALSDVCWVGNGYGSCTELRATYSGQEAP